MKQLLPFSWFLTAVWCLGMLPGCLASEPEYVAGYSVEPLMEEVVVAPPATEEEEDSEVVSPEPPARRVVVDNDLLEPSGLDDDELCICDWEIVEQSSLVCLAVVCSETCTADEIPCNADQRMCYPL